jgi:hypothetical protein
MVFAAFVLPASTRVRFAISQIAASYTLFIAALASTKPECLAESVAASTLDCNQSAESLIRDIDGFGHRTALIGSRSSGGLGASTPTRCAL